MKSTFSTVAQNITQELKIERSLFIGHTASATDEEEAKEFITRVRGEHSQATHNCYAYRLGQTAQPIEYYSDHGEPSGTAGRPILNAILQADLTNTVVVVTRYFGGKKLGIRGLIDAYHSTAALVLAAAGQKVIIPSFRLSITCEYNCLSQINYLLEKFGGKIHSTEYGMNIKIQATLPEECRTEAIPALSTLAKVCTE